MNAFQISTPGFFLLMLPLLIGFVIWFTNFVHVCWLVRSSWISKTTCCYSLQEPFFRYPVTSEPKINPGRPQGQSREIDIYLFECIAQETVSQNLVLNLNQKPLFLKSWIIKKCKKKTKQKKQTNKQKTHQIASLKSLCTTNSKVLLNVKWKPGIIDLLSLKFLATIASSSLPVRKFTYD